VPDEIDNVNWVQGPQRFCISIDGGPATDLGAVRQREHGRAADLAFTKNGALRRMMNS